MCGGTWNFLDQFLDSLPNVSSEWKVKDYHNEYRTSRPRREPADQDGALLRGYRAHPHRTAPGKRLPHIQRGRCAQTEFHPQSPRLRLLHRRMPPASGSLREPDAFERRRQTHHHGTSAPCRRQDAGIAVPARRADASGGCVSWGRAAGLSHTRRVGGRKPGLGAAIPLTEDETAGPRNRHAPPATNSDWRPTASRDRCRPPAECG